MLEKIWIKGNPHALFMRMKIDVPTMENSVEVLQEMKIGTPL